MVEVQLKEIPYLPLASNVTLSAAIVFLLIQINRFLAKEIFQQYYFKDEIEMPTTNYLLCKDKHFPVETKKIIRDKIKESSNIDLYSEEQERNDELSARKQICFAVSQIRALLRENDMLLRHNIEYGFFRNILGGCVLAIFFSLVGLFLSYPTRQQSGTFWFFLVFAIIYSIPLLLSKTLVKRHGAYYAKILYEQFLAHKSQP